jgi:hypothetical protein
MFKLINSVLVEPGQVCESLPDQCTIDLTSLDQTSVNSLVIEQEKFFQNLADQYESKLPSLGQALMNSLYDFTHVCI